MHVKARAVQALGHLEGPLGGGKELFDAVVVGQRSGQETRHRHNGGPTVGEGVDQQAALVDSLEALEERQPWR